MKSATHTVLEIFENLKNSFLQGSARKFTNEEPLRSELFSTDKLEEYGRSLAKSHKLFSGKIPNPLLHRLDENEAVLSEVHNLLVETIKNNHRVTPAGEWLLDNFYLIEEQIRIAKKHLPKGYNENLPQLISGNIIGPARVYDIALQIISHSDGRIDLHSLSGFVKAYQEIKNLQLGELWAIPIMLRVALIENLRRVSVRTAVDRIDRNLANYWAEQMFDTAEKDPKSLIMIIADMARSNPPLVSAFVSELTRKLRGKGPNLVLALDWIEQRLVENGIHSNDLINEENQKQAADQVSISNSISSLRMLSAMDWREFVESHSIVEQILREDIDGVYTRMDFESRDNYRHMIEYLANRSSKTEYEVAQEVIRFAKESDIKNPGERWKSHVGFYLVGSGLRIIKKQIRIRKSVEEIVLQNLAKRPVFIFISSIILITLSVTYFLFSEAVLETTSKKLLLLVGLLSMICASQFAIMIVNFFATLIAKPRLLSRVDYSKGIENESKTLVVVPSMLGSMKDVDSLVEDLEVRYLANKDENLHFGLLTDFPDARSETLPTDESILNVIRQKIEDLNKKYQRENDLFYLFHRPRRWNKHDRIWMGYERKRGKLFELNDLLRGKSIDRFSLTFGNLELLRGVKYVITLDADTMLPRGSAWKMVGTISHPLNRAFYDEKKKRVTHGYGILQPRVAMSLPETTSSLYAKLNGNEPGIDPYTRATSDVYQDLFGEGSFIGKGIYEVDAFEKAISGKFPENRILSHDLLEGCYARSGLLSDVQLFERHPNSYSADVKRRARWIRGDWQIAIWFTPFVRNQNWQWKRNPLSMLSRWKIFDNIRRSLVPIALTLLILAGWVLMHAPLFWTLAVSAMVVLPVIISSIWEILYKPKEIILWHHLITSGRSVGNIFTRTMFTLICFPYEAYFTLSAIVKTCWRMAITHRKLLEWNPFANEEAKKSDSLFRSYTTMWFAIFISICVFVYLENFTPEKLSVASPILVLWLLAPYITWYASQPLKKQLAKITKEQDIYLLNLARKTWSFFERFVTQEDNWLPPDNFQEYPVQAIAHRTSPTNIGLSLLSNLTAYDFGYIAVDRLIERSTNTFNTLHKLERHNGHLYNWYDTISLVPLLPKYISTVDSGNFAGHLLTLRQGLLGIAHENILRPKLFEGLRDTLRVFSGLLSHENVKLPDELMITLDEAVNSQNISIEYLIILNEKLNSTFKNSVEDIQTIPGSELNWWKEAFFQHIHEITENVRILSPWMFMLDAPARFSKIIDINQTPTLTGLWKITSEIETEINRLKSENILQEENEWLNTFHQAMLESGKIAVTRIVALEELAQNCNDFAEMEWEFLYDKARHLLTIGYKVDEHHCDPSYYDLLASEARLCTFVTIAQGKLPEESWFSLGRLLANVSGDPILLSWSGSMFEYLMPLLVMPTYDNTLLDRTYKTCVEKQIEYGRQNDVPWGISESGYNMVDAASNYQYNAFGAPGLGLKRGLAEELVIAPYATALALMVEPEKACQNLQRLSEKGFEGRYGMYEAIDYTPSRLSRKQTFAVVQSYMAHHQGMSLLSLGYLIHDKLMQKRFESEPQFKATLLLLQERIPKTTTYFSASAEVSDISYAPSGTEVRITNTANTSIPVLQLLSNGKYHLMVTNSGGSYSRWKGLAVTRWAEDVTCDNWGTFCYIRDLENGNFWSNTYQPTLKKGTSYETAFSDGRVDFRSSINNLETHTEIVVSPEDDIEMRRINITNRSGRKRTIDVTSYAEVVLATMEADRIHPAFSKLFVQTEIIPNRHAILCTRRKRSAEENPPWMFHLMMVHGMPVQEISFETDRKFFIGRGNTTANPDALNKNGPLSGRQGSVLDPIVSIRNKVELEEGETVIVDIITGIGESRSVCEALIEKYQDKHHKDRVFELAWTHSQVVLRQINAKEADAQLYGQLASSIIFNNSALRADSTVIVKNQRGQSDLWGYSVSGDLPIVLLRIEDQSNIPLVKQMIQAHTYWRLKGLIVDLVIWNEDFGGYRQILQNEIQAIIAAETVDSPGGIFLRSAEQISNEDRILFQTVARLIISDTGGSLAEHVNRKQPTKVIIPNIVPSKTHVSKPANIQLKEELTFFNGFGGFTSDGKEYVISVDNKKMVPSPWVNVIANKNFGTVISESGQSYSWMENAHEYRLSPWNNDPVSDQSGEVFYIRDEETKHFWSPTPLPKIGQSNYVVRHGFGYSVFEHIENGIYSEMKVFVDTDSPIKFTIIKIKNNSGETRKLSATGYVEWVLGDLRQKTTMHIVTELDPDSGALMARNPYNTEFSKRVAYFDVDETHRTFTGDRTDFIGRNNSLQNPDAMSRQKLSGRIGSGFDPCGAIQVAFELADGEEREVIFRLGSGNYFKEASNNARRFKGDKKAHKVFESVVDYWKKALGTLTVDTPDKATNILANGWLTYQTLVSRLWGRSGYYQSGGAFGFRDQLQDVMSLLHTEPGIARQQILLCSSRQFKEGDVQHWWHPPSGRGVRTRCSDDYLWLPYVTSRYVRHTDDKEILNEISPFLKGRQLNSGEDSYYDLPTISRKTVTLYEHCVRAIRNGMKYGVHGLPLMGSGDWNDGMDRVGIHGKGESVWLAFFLYDNLIRFIEIARMQNDLEFAEECEKEAQKLKENIEKNGWDGKWYRRAYYDNGRPLGSEQNTECQIDSLSQSWSVLSGAADPKRSAMGVKAADQRLVLNDQKIIRLLDPPLDKSPSDPGYIKGYVPGVRENGGQYTHAAVWLIMAHIKLGNNKRAWELLTMINPINHARNPEEVNTYRVEPYVVAADVYTLTPHTGHGGWTWYTGSAAWMYQLITDSFLGIRISGNKLSFKPSVPEEWESFGINYRYNNSLYKIVVRQKNESGKTSITLNGISQPDDFILLEDDGREHEAEVIFYTNGNGEMSNVDGESSESDIKSR